MAVIGSASILTYNFTVSDAVGAKRLALRLQFREVIGVFHCVVYDPVSYAISTGQSSWFFAERSGFTAELLKVVPAATTPINLPLINSMTVDLTTNTMTALTLNAAGGLTLTDILPLSPIRVL